MKSNIIKYIFIAFAIFIIGFAIYKINYEDQDDEQEDEETAQTSQETESILYIGISDFDNINPLITDNKDIVNLSTIIYEPLFKITDDYKLESALASEWSKLDEKTYLITLKDNVKWEDGSSVTGTDVKFTIETLQEGGSSYTDNVSNIKSVEIIDGNNIRIELKEEEAFFEYNLIFPIVSSAQFEGEDDFYESRLAPMATGMYKVTEATTESMELSINENWENPDGVELKIDKVILTFFDTMGDAFNSLKIGNIDLVCTSITNVEDYIGTIGFNTTKYKGRELDFISINCTEGVLADANVRKAINYAIDKDKINSSIFSNNNYVSSFPLDYGSFLYNQEGQSDYNKSKAEDALEEAGWEYRYGYWRKTENYTTQYLNINIVVDSSNETRVAVAEEIEEQLEDIGINVYVQKVSNSTYKKYLENKNYDMIITGINNGYSPDLSYFFGEDNIANYENEEMTSLLEEVKNITDENTLKEKYSRIVEIFEEDRPYICLYRNVDKVVYSIRVTGTVIPNNYTAYNHFETWYRQ